jgi:hypothetical protein
MESVSWFDALRRRWAELLRWISRARTRPAQAALPARLSEETGAAVSSSLSSGMEAPVVVQVVSEAPVEATAPPNAAVSGPTEGLREPGYAGLSVRLYFNRLLAATPEGLSVDFTRWQTASVERFFLAMTSPGLVRRREAPTTGDERLTLPTAFEGFEWD